MGDEQKTAYVMGYRSYEFLVMPFGITNAFATFSNSMNDVLYEFVGQFIIVYLDDIVVYSKNVDTHVRHLRRVFARLKQHYLYVKKEKLSYFAPK